MERFTGKIDEETSKKIFEFRSKGYGSGLIARYLNLRTSWVERFFKDNGLNYSREKVNELRRNNPDLFPQNRKRGI